MTQHLRTSAFGKLVKDDHRRVARTVAYALTNCDHTAMVQLRAVLRARLSPPETAALAWSALGALDPEDAHSTATTVLDSARVGMPLPPFIDFVDEAAFWADMAGGEELEAYCLATYNRLRPSRQMAFRDFVNERAAA